MMKTSVHTCSLKALLLSAVASWGMSSCDQILDNGYGLCEEDATEYRIKFKYDYNMKYADAFAHEVKSVTLYAFDGNGRFVCQQTDSGEKLAAADYTMLLNLEDGEYHFVTWAGLAGETSFAVPTLTEGVSTIDELTCQMNRTRQDEAAIVNHDLAPLFHGELTHQSIARAVEQRIITMPLMKNTNSIRIVLQHLSREDVDVSKFDFRIADANGWMNYDNRLLDDEELTYLPWYQAQGTVKNDVAEGNISVAVAQLAVGRLMADRHPRLIITNRETGQAVVNIPLTDYLLLVKGQYHQAMTDQEYLDRQDEYSLTFFLDEKDEWYSARILVNGWAIVRDEIGL